MDFTEAKELRSAGEMDDETIAKKRLRRVSFAETTAVHVFDRDDDFDTPPDAKPGSADGSTPGSGGKVAGFPVDHSDSDDSKCSAREDDDEDNDEDEGEQVLFVRDMDSSSPGSAVGSVTSNDDDNFFGPVSASFIRSGRLSESGMSEDIDHDITLDSTAFSLHFRNIALLDDCSANSAGSIRTPAAEETLPPNTGESMVPVGFKKRIADTKISDGSMTSSAGGSNSMSLIVEFPHKYDYGKISPTLEALLAEVDRSLKPVSPNNGIRVVTSSHQISEVAEVKESGKDEPHIGNRVDSDYMADDGCSMGIGTNQIAEANPSTDMHASPLMHATTNDETQECCFTPGASGTIRSSSLLEGNRLQSSTPFTTSIPNNVRNLRSLKELADNDITSQNSQGEIENSRDLCLGSQDMNIEIKEDLNNVREKFSEKEIFASSCEPGSGGAHKEVSIISKSKFYFDTVQSPDKECDSSTDNNILHLFNLMESMSPTSTQDLNLQDYEVNHQDLLSVRESFSAQDVDIIGRKRKTEHIPLNEKDHMNEISRAQKSPKFLPKTAGIIPGSSLGHHIECNNEANSIEGHSTPKNCTDIIFRLSEATKQLFSPYKLILREIDILEDLLGELQKARKYERLCTSLRTGECFGDAHQKRVAEARSLRDKLVFEQAKLQLKHMKLDLLRNEAQLSLSRVWECDKLKSIFSQLCCRGATASQTHEIQLHSNSTNSDSRNQEERNKVASMRQELEILNQKVEHLVKSFETSCNIKGNMDCDEIIKAVNVQLETSRRCRVIHQDLQLWKLSDVVKKNNQSEIVLNYCDLLFQRVTINSGQVSNVIVNNTLNDANIEKNFPNMNACMAFEFVFKAKDSRRLSNAKCFQQETLVTNLLLGTLLDMLEEVRASKIQLWNLIVASFHSQHPGQLELHLCFLNLKSGCKVTVALDLTDLGCAAYPSNPSELQFRMISGAQTTLPPSVFDEITSAVQSLQAGRPMILRLCQCISQVVQASS